MTSLTRIVDFSLAAPQDVERPEKTRRVNTALAATGEPIRLWLSDRSIGQQIRGPFRKIAMTFVDETVWTPRRIVVMNARPVCSVRIPLSTKQLEERAPDHRWVLSRVKEGLSAISESQQAEMWHSADLEQFISDLTRRSMPLVHQFERLRKTDRRTGAVVVPWVAYWPGEAKVGVRITTDSNERDKIIYAQASPIWFEQDFPMKKSAIIGSEFVILDRNGNTLSKVSIS